MPETARVFKATESDAGLRLDKFVASRLPEYSRSEIQKFDIKDSGRPARKIKLSDKIKSGDKYEIGIPERHLPGTSCLLPHTSSLTLDILFEDPHIIVVNKPRGVAMYPGAGRDAGTLVQDVLAHTSLSSIGADGGRPGVVHRLDKDTSGIVVFAKTDAAHRALTKTFAAHDIVRKYVAFAWGVPNWEGADISGNIGRSTRNRQKMTMLKVGGKPARTHADVIAAWPRDNISQLRCTLETGRTHQIRVHLSAHGFPVVCDQLYGRGAARLGGVKNPGLLEFLRGRQPGSGREGQMLHAEVLELAHPITGEALRFKAKMPEDMRELKALLDG